MVIRVSSPSAYHSVQSGEVWRDGVFPDDSAVLFKQRRGRPICEGMRRAPAFADVLEEKLGGMTEGWRPLGEAARAGGWSPAMRPGPNPAILFGGFAPGSQSDVAPGAVRHLYDCGVPSDGARRPSRPHRNLSSSQRQALECLCRFGAGALDDTCSDAEIRSAFRSLALRFHPDRHPTADAQERAYLSGAFDRITQAYRQLTSPAALS